MKFFTRRCPYCGKENMVDNPWADGFCDKVHETNYKYEQKYKVKA